MYSVVGSDGQVYGPVDMATLSQWIAEGRVTPTTNLIDPLDGRVIQAGHAPALMGNFPPVPVQAPPQAPGFGGAAMPNPYATPASYGYPRPGTVMGYSGPPKSKLVAILLALFLGGVGMHRFYLGHVSTGIALLALWLAGFVTCGVTWLVVGIWALVDLIQIATGTLREANGRALV